MILVLDLERHRPIAEGCSNYMTFWYSEDIWMFEYGLQLGQLTIFFPFLIINIFNVYWTIILGKILVLRFDTKNVQQAQNQA